MTQAHTPKVNALLEMLDQIDLEIAAAASWNRITKHFEMQTPHGTPPGRYIVLTLEEAQILARCLVRELFDRGFRLGRPE